MANEFEFNRMTGNSFTPWFKLIVENYLYGWWDQLLQQWTNGRIDAMNLRDKGLVGQKLKGVDDRNTIIRMI